jgi:glycopeptide antibiotics resistance protein
LRGRFAIVSIIAGLGLIAWEILQQSSHALVFDLHDIGATLMGLGIGILLFVLLTPKENEPFA